MQGLDVLLRLGLEEVLVAEPADGVAGAGLGRAEDGEAHTGPVQQAGDRLGGLARPLVESPRTADPEEVLDIGGDRALDDGDLEVQALGPFEALGGPEPPRVAPVLDVAQHERGLSRETGLDQDLVAAHVDDGVDVLDVHRALLDAGPARRAGPEDVVCDHLRHEGPPLASEELVAKVHDDELGGERLAGVPGGALALATSALGAGHEVQELLPREMLDLAGPEDGVLVHRLDVDLGRLVEGAEPRRLPAVGDVQGCHEDVKVLGVHHEHEEGHDHDDVQVDEDRLEGAVGGHAEAAERPPEAVGGECPPSVREVARVGLSRPVQKQRDDHEGDHPERYPGGGRVRAVEARLRDRSVSGRSGGG